MSHPDPCPEPSVSPVSALWHPSWCDRSRCSATAEGAVGQAHRSALVSIAAEGINGVAVTLTLSRAHAPWPTVTYVDVCVSGLHDAHYLPVAGAGALTVRQAVDLGQALLDLGRLAGAPRQVDR